MINARAQNAYGVAHFAQQNAVPQARWENIDIIGQYMDNLQKQKALEMADKNYELEKDKTALYRDKFNWEKDNHGKVTDQDRYKAQNDMDRLLAEYKYKRELQAQDNAYKMGQISAGGKTMLDNNPEYKAFRAQVNDAIKFINATDLSQISKKEYEFIEELSNTLGKDVLGGKGNMENLYYRLKYNPKDFASIMSKNFS